MLEKPKSGEISDVPRLKVGDRGATAVWDTLFSRLLIQVGMDCDQEIPPNRTVELYYSITLRGRLFRASPRFAAPSY